MKINFLFFGSAAAVLDDSSTLLSMSTKSTAAADLISAVGHRNVTQMQALVQGLAHESVNEPAWKFDADIRSALKAIQEIFVTKIQGALKDQHKADQEHFNCFTKDCFEACNTDFESKHAHCRTKGVECDELRTEHDTCRSTVYDLYKDMAKACTKLHCFDVPTTTCEDESCLCPGLSYCHEARRGEECEAQTGDCTGKFGGWLQQQLGIYQASFAQWTTEHADCKAKYHKFLTADMECDKTQKSFETCSCEHSRCDYENCRIDFTQCTEQCWTRYEELVTEKECLEKDRKIDWSATKKIECYVDVLLHNYTKNELLTKCGSDDCINTAREEDYKHCSTICQQIDHDGQWPSVLGNQAQGHPSRDAKSKFHLGDNEYKCDANGAGVVFTMHRAAGDDDSARADENRCTEHLDIDYQIPQCSTPDCEEVPICDATFLATHYAKYDDIEKIGCISDCCPDDSKESCFPAQNLESGEQADDGSFTLKDIKVTEHSHAWAYNRCECTPCPGGFPEYPAPRFKCGDGAHTIKGRGQTTTKVELPTDNCPTPAGAQTCHFWGEPHFTHVFSATSDREVKKGGRSHGSKQFDYNPVGLFNLAASKDRSFEAQAFFCPFSGTSTGVAVAAKFDKDLVHIIRGGNTKAAQKGGYANFTGAEKTWTEFYVNGKHVSWEELGSSTGTRGNTVAGTGGHLGRNSFMQQMKTTHEGQLSFLPVCAGNGVDTLVEVSTPALAHVYEQAVTIRTSDPAHFGICGIQGGTGRLGAEYDAQFRTDLKKSLFSVKQLKKLYDDCGVAMNDPPPSHNVTPEEMCSNTGFNLREAEEECREAGLDATDDWFSTCVLEECASGRGAASITQSEHLAEESNES